MTEDSKRSSQYYSRRRSISNNNRNSIQMPLSPSPSVPDMKVNWPSPELKAATMDSSNGNTKLVSEINMKNAIIFEMKQKENYLLVQLATLKRTQTIEYSDHSSQLVDIESQEARQKLLQTLISFKGELNKTREIVEGNKNLVRTLEAQKTSLEQQVENLKKGLKGDNNQELIQMLQDSLYMKTTEISQLESKIDLWARSSKRNQDARVQAESSLKSIEIEMAKLKKKSNDDDESDGSSKSESRIDLVQVSDPFESQVSELISGMEDLERENANLRVKVEITEILNSELQLKLQSANQENYQDDNMLKQRISQLEKLLVLERQAHVTEVTQLTNRIAGDDIDGVMNDLIQKCAKLEDEKMAANSTVSSLESQIEDLKAGNSALERNIKISEARRELSDEETSRLSIAVMELENELREVEMMKTRVETSLNSAQYQIESLNLEVEELRKL